MTPTRLDGGGRGIETMWATQSLAQLRARYGAIPDAAPFHAWLFWRSEPHFQTEARPAGLIPEFVRMKGFTP